MHETISSFSDDDKEGYTTKLNSTTSSAPATRTPVSNVFLCHLYHQWSAGERVPHCGHCSGCCCDLHSADSYCCSGSADNCAHPTEKI